MPSEAAVHILHSALPVLLQIQLTLGMSPIHILSSGNIDSLRNVLERHRPCRVLMGPFDPGRVVRIPL
jgi:hypothetical protein